MGGGIWKKPNSFVLEPAGVPGAVHKLSTSSDREGGRYEKEGVEIGVQGHMGGNGKIIVGMKGERQRAIDGRGHRKREGWGERREGRWREGEKRGGDRKMEENK